MTSTTEYERLYFKTLKRVDPFIKSLLFASVNVQVFMFNFHNNEWLEHLEGILLVYNRHINPHHGLVVLNNYSQSMIMESLDSDISWKAGMPYVLIFKHWKTTMYRVVFSKSNDCIKMTNLLRCIMNQIHISESFMYTNGPTRINVDPCRSNTMFNFPDPPILNCIRFHQNPPNAPFPVRVGATVPVRAGATVPVRAGATLPIRAGATAPVRAGATVPVRAGATVPVRAGATVPVRAGAPVPVRAGAPVPVRAGAPVPVRAGATIPVRASATVPVIAGAAAAPATVTAPVRVLPRAYAEVAASKPPPKKIVNQTPPKQAPIMERPKYNYRPQQPRNPTNKGHTIHSFQRVMNKDPRITNKFHDNFQRARGTGRR